LDLILWRHAEAVDPAGDDAAADTADDLQRPLTPRGERQAALMAEWLNRRLPATTRVIASPAVRARQTAEALERKFRTVPALAPSASVTMLLEAARWPQSKEPVLVVGHQPTLGQTAAWLLAGVTQPWAVKKGAVWWLRSREREGEGQVVLVVSIAPDQLRT
jgi:phosphohistidine phosphatase